MLSNFSFLKTKLNTKKRMSTKTFMSIISSETIFRTPKKSIEYKSKSMLASFMPDFTSTPNIIIPKTSTPDIKVKEKPTKLRRIKKKTIDKKKKKYDNFFNRFNSTFKDYSFDDISNLNKYFIKTKLNTLACHCENTNANIFYGSFKKNCYC